MSTEPNPKPRRTGSLSKWQDIPDFLRQSVEVERTAAELTSLAAYEVVIERGLATFIEVGKALIAIRDKRLYREAHTTFEDYCRERWKFNDRRASQMIQAAEVSTIVEGPRPRNEAVARELAPLLDDPEQLRSKWVQVVELHGPTPTARQVRDVVQVVPYTSCSHCHRKVRADRPHNCPEHPAIRSKPSLGVPEPKADFYVRMAGPISRLADATAAVISTWDQYGDTASEQGMESARDDIAAAAADLTRFLDRVSPLANP